jgi:enolase
VTSTGITIAAVDAGWLLDSRATPTIEVTITLSDGSRHRAMAPAGASTGSHESAELRDLGDPRWRGRGVGAAIAAAREIAGPALAGLPPDDQAALDARLVEADGTARRDRLGANAMVAASVAVARAGAAVTGRELWQHLGDGRRPLLPVPMVNILSGHLHAAGGMGIQDVLVIPAGAGSTGEALEWVHDVYHATGDLLRARGASVLVGDEGGYGAPAPSAGPVGALVSGSASGEAIALVTEAIAATGRRAPDEVGIALDVAATHLVRADGSYDLDGRRYTREGLAGLLAGWAEDFPVLSVEDPFGEDDWAAWQDFARRCPGLQLVGDDLIATHLDRLHRAARDGAANTVLTKVNQIGTVTEALTVADEAARLGMRAVISARSGETEDDWLADLAVASGAGQIKVGSVARSERLAKYNRLLRIERSAQAPPYAGLLPFSPPDQGTASREPGSRS